MTELLRLIYRLQTDVTYTSDSTIIIPSDATNVEITVASGKGGDGGDDAGAVGGQGGNGRAGKFTLSDGARTLFMSCLLYHI